MIVGSVQRWRSRQGSYRPLGEPINHRAYEVAPIVGDGDAKAFVVRHHYSGSYPAARVRIGLYRASELVGVAVFSVPANALALDPAPGDRHSRAELGRFVLLDDVPSNGESWFLARCFEILRRTGYTGIVSFSDPVARLSADGSQVFPGHIGTIYQATNAIYLGRSRPAKVLLLPDGSLIHPRALAKIRKRDQGWRYAAALLEAHGAAPLGEVADPCVWLDRWLPRLTRRMSHGGNCKYAWALHKRDRKHLPPSKGYPKLTQLDLGPGIVAG